MYREYEKIDFAKTKKIGIGMKMGTNHKEIKVDRPWIAKIATCKKMNRVRTRRYKENDTETKN